MKFIKQIEIRKFRSINHLKAYKTNDLNIFVGKNDQGKSNILRALNLFFNNETDLMQKFRFEQDYCFHANTGTGTRKEIRIDLIISPPKGRFKINSDIRWIKKWKQDGSIIDERTVLKTGEKLDTNSNINKWLNKIIFRYVPAIKGEKYFQILMEELHDVLNLRFRDEINKKGTTFISGLQEITQNITDDLDKSLGLKNTLQVPSDFKQLFSRLDFGVYDEGKIYHLTQRGDGIKVRHIPIILFHMAREEQNLSIPGYVKPNTIWGFEEPENNLELKYCFDLAQEFINYADDLQIFVTTHSPAFYSIKDNDKTSIGFVSKNTDKCTVISDPTTEDEIHEEMGLLPLITPFIKQINDNKNEILYLQSQLRHLGHHVNYIILTEDQDTKFLECFLDLNHHKKNETEIISYGTSSKLTTSAFSIAEYIKSKKENVKILIHRDQDYLSIEEIQTLREKIKSKGFYSYITPKVDLESLFVNVEHIDFLYPKLGKIKISECIDECIQDAHEDSLKRYINHKMQATNNVKENPYGLMKELTAEYEINENNLFYGKKVYGLLQNKLHSLIKSRPNLLQTSPYIVSNEIRDFFKTTI